METVQVYLRLRPLASVSKCVALSSPTTVKHGELSFTFDTIFGDTAQQDYIFTKIGKPLLQQLLLGYNVCVVCYGSTGSGKTHTMFGSGGANAGLIPRFSEALFAVMPAGTRVSLQCLEIYMENIYDLLEEKGEKPKVIRELPDGTVFIDGVRQVYVTSQKDVLRWIQVADIGRTIAATLMNDRSSRSHCLFQLHVEQPSGLHSWVSLVDLAGSEKVKKSGASGVILQQAQHINKSLFNLSNVIHLLSEGSRGHIPYRDSKLTRILQDSLGGNSKTAVIITALQSVAEAEETLSTLRFGLRCKSVFNKPKVNVVEDTLETYKQKLADAEKEIQRLRALPSSPASALACERCKELEKELEEFRLQAAAQASLLNLEEGDIQKYVVPPLDQDEPLSASELRARIGQHETAQKYMLLRQHYILKLLANRNAVLQALEKKMFQ